MLPLIQCYPNSGIHSFGDAWGQLLYLNVPVFQLVGFPLLTDAMWMLKVAFPSHPPSPVCYMQELTSSGGAVAVQIDPPVVG